MAIKKGFIYILSSNNNRVLYTGVTNNLIKRVYQHKSKQVEGFTKKYNCTKLVYFEELADITIAIEREKQIKAGSRNKKEALINSINEQWNDLFKELL